MMLSAVTLRPRLALVAAAVIVAASVPTEVRSSGKQAPVDAPASAAVDIGVIAKTVREYLGETWVPGAAVAVTLGERVLLAEGYGHTSSGEPVTAHTPMAVASISKSFTALAVMQLVEAGRAELDAPVRRYLPEFKMADSRVDQMTVRHLLNQTSVCPIGRSARSAGHNRVRCESWWLACTLPDWPARQDRSGSITTRTIKSPRGWSRW